MKKAFSILLALILVMTMLSCETDPNKGNDDGRIVIKVRNSSLVPGSEYIGVDAFGDEGPLFDPSLSIPVTEGQFTEIPVDDSFLEAFKRARRVEFAISSMIPDMKDQTFVVYLSYSPDQNVYIIERPASVTVTVKLKQPVMVQTPKKISWIIEGESGIIDYDPEATEYELATLEVPGEMYGFNVTIKILGEGGKELSAVYTNCKLEKGKTVYYVEEGDEQVARTLEIKPGEYMVPVKHYRISVDDVLEYNDVDASPSGNTVLHVSDKFREGQEWRLSIMGDDRHTGNGFMGEYKGTIHIEPGSDKIVLEPQKPWGRMKANFHPTFWTDIIFWKYERKIGDEWVLQEGSPTWNPRAKNMDHYYLEPGTYRLVNMHADEHHNVGDGARSEDFPDPIEFTIESGKETVVGASFSSASYRDIRVRIKGASGLKCRATMFFKDIHYEVTQYSQLFDGYSGQDSFDFELYSAPEDLTQITLTITDTNPTQTKTFTVDKIDKETNTLTWII